MTLATTTFGLIERARQGDQAAFSALFERHHRRLAVLIHCRMGTGLAEHMTVDDLLQETFMRAFRDFARFEYRGAGSFFRWLSSISGHCIADAARHRDRRRRRASALLRFRSASHPGGVEPRDSRTPSRVLGEEEALLRLLKTLDGLPRQYKEAILLCKVEGLSTPELAERLGKSREAAALLLHRAVRRFRQVREAEGAP